MQGGGHLPRHWEIAAPEADTPSIFKISLRGYG